MNQAMIVEALRSVTMTTAANPAMTPAAPAPVASPDAVARFQAAMGTEATAAPYAVPFADQIAGVWRASQVRNQEALHRIRALSQLNQQDGSSMAKLVELQYEVANLSFQQNLVSKVADKTSSAVQTLIKNQ